MVLFMYMVSLAEAALNQWVLNVLLQITSPSSIYLSVAISLLCIYLIRTVLINQLICLYCTIQSPLTMFEDEAAISKIFQTLEAPVLTCVGRSLTIFSFLSCKTLLYPNKISTPRIKSYINTKSLESTKEFKHPNLEIPENLYLCF